jgi:threonine synthase
MLPARAGSFVTHLESAIDGTHIPARTLQTTHAGRPLWVRYDLDGIARAVRPGDLRDRPHTMWRYREFLPFEDQADVVSIGETVTPLIRCERLGRELGLDNLFIKDESRLPTGSFKSRGMAMAVTMAKALDVKRVAAPTAGNAGGALAAYAARAGLECFIFMPHDTPVVNQLEVVLHGAKAFLVNGLIHDCGRIVAEGAKALDWFNMSTLKEPYRLEGKKTMGLELAEQFDWNLPEAIFYPTGGGTGLIGMWKAFIELRSIGWLVGAGAECVSPSLGGRGLGGGSPSQSAAQRASAGAGSSLPRLFSCQSSGCDPITRAFESGERFATPPPAPHTIASGLRVPKALGDFMILDAVRASGGRAMSADESTLLPWMRRASSLEGIALCPESAACVACAKAAHEHGWIGPSDRVVIFNTGAAQKYVEAMREGVTLPTLDTQKPIDWDALAR